MTDFLRSQGALALGSRLRAISDHLFAQGDVVYAAHGLKMRSRWFPVLSLLAEKGPQTVTQIAEQVNFSHPAVIALARKIEAVGWIENHKDPQDERRRLIALSDSGREQIRLLRPIWDQFRNTAADAIEHSGTDFIAALDRFEAELTHRPWPQEMARRLPPEVQIIDYEARYQADFEALNVEWLERYFSVEPVDHQVLSDPERHIIQPGGAIIFARLGELIVGTCALKYQGDGVFELTKMGVTSTHQRVGIGAALMNAVIERFQDLDGQQLYLETNAVLAPAIKLYAGHGFVDQGQRKPGSVYQRSDVYMIWQPD